MRRYETIYIIRPNASEDDITAVIDRTNGIIEQFGGNIVQLDRWWLKKIAYLIKKEKLGFYVYSEYAVTTEAVDELERLFRIDDKVLKYMTIKTQEEFTDDFNQKAPEEAEEGAEAVKVEETEEAAQPVSTDE